MQQVKETSELYGRLENTITQVRCLERLTLLLLDDGQLDAAEDATSHTFDLISEKGHEHLSCQSHHYLSKIYHHKGEKAIHHFKIALDTASTFDWRDQLFSIHCDLAPLFLDERSFNDALAHVEQAKFQTTEDRFFLGFAMVVQARVLYQQRMFEDSKSEALGALGIFEKLGAAKRAAFCRDIIRNYRKRVYQYPVVSFRT